MSKPWVKKAVSVMVSFGLFYFIGIHSHEAGHYLAAWQLGIPGYVDYTWLGGRFNYDPQWALQFYDPVAQVYHLPWEWLVGLSGGLLVALVYGVLALIAKWQADVCPWETDDLVSLFPISMFHLAYGITEAGGLHVYWGVLVAVAVSTPALAWAVFRARDWILGVEER